MSRPPDALSPQSITQLSDFDNYEIYSIIAACLPAVTVTRYYRGYVGENWVNNIRVSASPAEISANSNPSGYYTRTQAVYSANTGDGGYKYDDFVFDRFIGANYAPGQYFENTSAKARKLYAIQTYSPKYQVDFTGIKSVMDAYAPKIGSGWIIGVNGYRAVQWFTPVSEFDWSKLAVDGRLKFSGISDSDGVLTYSYWAHNPLEQHPQINLTCDYRSHTIAVSQGKPFTIDLHYPIAQTLKISNSLLAGILVEQFSDVTGNKPANFAEYLIGSTAYAIRIEQLYPPPPADPIPIQPPNDDRVIRESWNKQLLPSGGNVGGWIYKLDGTVIGRENPDTTTGRAIYTSPTLEYQILPAENDLWGQGATLPTYAPFNCSIPDLPMGITYDRLHFEPQTDGSFGELIMDSPRTIENNEMLKKILAALGAEVYATDPETGEPRTWNLGKIIESIGNFCGLRRQPNGKFLTTTEADKYKRTRLSNPTWAAGAYDTKQWGNKGFAMRFLPTQYKEGQRQDNQYTLVHDLPQMFLELLDQLDHSQGLQHSGAIRADIGGEIQAYPNQGAMMQDMALRTIETQALAEKSLVLAIETANTVRELFPAIGIPVATKSVTAQIGGKSQAINYPAFQAGKLSIRDKIGGLEVNIGNLQGSLMPRIVKNPKLNPFDRSPEG